MVGTNSPAASFSFQPSSTGWRQAVSIPKALARVRAWSRTQTRRREAFSPNGYEMRAGSDNRRVVRPDGPFLRVGSHLRLLPPFRESPFREPPSSGTVHVPPIAFTISEQLDQRVDCSF